MVVEKHILQDLPREILDRAGVLEAECLSSFPK
jgi:hypothetical protein